MLGFHFYWTEQYQINFADSEAIKNQWKALYVTCLVLERGHLTVFSHCNSVFLAPSSMLAAVIMQLCLK